MSVEDTLAIRGNRYGDFTDHARLCQDLMGVMQNFTKPGEEFQAEQQPWFELDPVKRQALTVIADKIARILSGDSNYDDNWHDIQGYAKLVEDRLPCNVAKREKEEFDKLPPQVQAAMTQLEKSVFYGDPKKEETPTPKKELTLAEKLSQHALRTQP